MGDTKILVVDDEPRMRKLVRDFLVKDGYLVVEAADGEEALTLFMQTKDIALVIMDVMMPKMDGYEACEEIRKLSKVPIILLTAKSEEKDELKGFSLGVDEYITKPFNPVTLGAKAKALVRRSRSSVSDDNPVLEVGPFTYDTQTLRFYKDGVEIPLSAKENAMIKLFIDNVGRIFSKDMIYSMIWGETIIDENAIMVYVNRLRQKIEDDPSEPQYIQTVRGLGYKFIV